MMKGGEERERRKIEWRRTEERGDWCRKREGEMRKSVKGKRKKGGERGKRKCKSGGKA